MDEPAWPDNQPDTTAEHREMVLQGVWRRVAQGLLTIEEARRISARLQQRQPRADAPDSGVGTSNGEDADTGERARIGNETG